MTTQQEEFLKQLQAIFKVEAAEHLQAITAGLLDLEKSPAPEQQRQIVETVFRAAHSLKGAARAVDFTEIESLCQTLEDVFAAWKQGQSDSSVAALDSLHRTLDAIASAMSAPPAAEGATASPAVFDPPGRPPQAPTAGDPQEPAPAPATTNEDFSAPQTVRVDVAKLEARLVEAAEMLGVKLSARQRAQDSRELAQRLTAWRDECAAVEPQLRALRRALDRTETGGAHPSSSAGLTRLLAFVDWNLDQVKAMQGEATALSQAAQQDLHVIGKRLDDLLEASKKLLLLPFATLSAALPKLVRDLCRDQGKEAELIVHGKNIEIEKSILEEMKDPLIHLLRNSIDHGIETAAERTRCGKPPRATIKLGVSHISGNQVELTVSDDGAGIDTGKVRAAAVKRGLVSAQDAARLSEPEAQALIFESDLSTSAMITRLSGRGLGLAIVQEKVSKLGGSISVDSQAGYGTAFRIVLPATRATFRGILVMAAGRLLVVPTVQVQHVLRAQPDDIRTVEGRETLSFAGRAMSLVWLAQVLQLPPTQHADPCAGGVPVIVLGAGEQRVAFAVDAVLDEQEILVKPLAKPLSRVRNIAAATVLGSGQVAPILNVADLLKSARHVAGAGVRAAAQTKPEHAKAVLVADDSITSRMLIKNILESAGYKVTTAVDGMEAFGLLRTESFDLLVSDVEMPRLNGFGLTARIRADKKLGELPVVLVTALETREDRERGVDAGANAYIVKSSFDQSNLIEAVQRLI